MPEGRSAGISTTHADQMLHRKGELPSATETPRSIKTKPTVLSATPYGMMEHSAKIKSWMYCGRNQQFQG